MIIFDFDGTIADTISLGIHLINDYSERFRYNKIDRETMNGLSAFELMKVMGIKLYRLPYLAWYLRKLLKNRASEIQMNPGIKDLLENLKQSGYKMGIVTSNSTENVNAFLERNGLESYFTYMKTKVPLLKKTKALSKTKRQLKTDFIYVGDEIRDVEACRKNNLPVVSVGWGFNSVETLEQVNPGFVARTADEATILIHKLTAF